jgi:hypothetical protein
MAERNARADSLGDRLADGRLIERALGMAVSAALEQHKRAGNPVAEWRDGKVVWVAPEDIVLPLKR